MMYFRNPFIEAFINWWHKWWGDDEGAKSPILKVRVAIAIVSFISFMVIVIIPIVLLQIHFEIFSMYSGGINPVLACLGLLYMSLGILLMRSGNKVTRRAWLAGKGKWWY